MKKITLLALALTFGSLSLTACSEPSSTGPQIPVTTNASKAKAETLLGQWSVTYKIVSYFTDTFRFSKVMELDSQPGEWFAGGYDQNNNLVVGWYDFKNATYVFGGGSDTLPALYLFKAINGTSISGCVTFKYNGSWTDCYVFNGSKISNSVATINSQSIGQAQEKMQSILNVYKTR